MHAEIRSQLGLLDQLLRRVLLSREEQSHSHEPPPPRPPSHEFLCLCVPRSSGRMRHNPYFRRSSARLTSRAICFAPTTVNTLGGTGIAEMIHVRAAP